ncbi:hypothetical protein LWI29_009394 [Acer saccharum]|uniref:TAFII55 protein conserved region domain-containing protein n=1 Tax=Acer saccharum TaxID=4024 RepID=A0AA39TCS3_ACESA|nr:hypothetical protein LWI29_009394 [Acer saccharum]
MEEQFILRVPPSVAELVNGLLSENAASDDKSLDLSFFEDGRSGTFVIGNDHFPVSLMDLPCVVESFKTYDDSALVKTGDIGQSVQPEVNEHEEDGDASENVPSAPAPEQPDVANGGEPEPERSDSDDSDDS